MTSHLDMNAFEYNTFSLGITLIAKGISKYGHFSWAAIASEVMVLVAELVNPAIYI